MSDDASEVPTAEGKHYDPEGYKNLAEIQAVYSLTGLLGFFLVIGMMVAAVIGPDGAKGAANVFKVLFVFVIALIALSLLYASKLKAHKQRVFDQKKAEADELAHAANANARITRDAYMKLEEQAELLELIQRAQSMGDIIISNNYAPVVISSKIVDSFNSIAVEDAELASALKTLGGYIEHSEDETAAGFFNELHQQIANQERNPTLIKALWSGIVETLPAVKDMTEIAAKITALFN